MIPPIRVLGSRFVEGTKDVEHLVQLAPDGVAQPAKPSDPVAAYVTKAYGGAAKLIGDSRS